MSFLSSSSSSTQKTVFATTKQNATIAHTGTTTETKIHSILIPAGTFAANDIWELYIKLGFTDNANNKTIKLYTNTSDSLAGATQIANYIATNNRPYSQFERRLTFKNSVSSQEILSTTVNGVTDEGAIAGRAALSIDFSVDQYLIFAITLATATDTATLYSHWSYIVR